MTSEVVMVTDYTNTLGPSQPVEILFHLSPEGSLWTWLNQG